MITSIVGIVAMIGELAYRFVVDYISNIIVGTILFPINTIQQGNQYAELLIKDLEDISDEM